MFQQDTMTSNCIWNIRRGEKIIINMGKRYKSSSKGIFMSLGFLIKISLRSKNKDALCELAGSVPAVHFEFLWWRTVFETLFMSQTGRIESIRVLMTSGSSRDVSFEPRSDQRDNGPLNCDEFTASRHDWMMHANVSRQVTSYIRSIVIEREHADSAGIKNYEKWIRALVNGSISLVTYIHTAPCHPSWWWLVPVLSSGQIMVWPL